MEDLIIEDCHGDELRFTDGVFVYVECNVLEFDCADDVERLALWLSDAAKKMREAQG